MRIITRTVWILSFVSLLTDMASEMLYPVVPVYLRDIGFSIFLIGLLEGLAELTVGLSKGYFGKRSDERGQRLPFIRLGYFLSAISKPMMAVFTWAPWIFLARTTDRLGKGLRTAPRDALLSAEASNATRGRIFAFHRGWDTVGAIIGPSLALAWLFFFPGKYTTLFFIALAPGLLSVLLLFALKEKKQVQAEGKAGGFFSYFSYWKEANSSYRQLVAGLLLFALANSSDVFLLLRAKEISGSDRTSVGAYIFYNIIYALSSYPMGILADKWGMKKTFLTGLLLFVVVYAGFGWIREPAWIWLFFCLYGIYAAATEGIAKAWIGNLAAREQTATAIGFYTSLQSIMGFSASLLAGFLWNRYGAMTTFYFSAMLALAAFAYLLGSKVRGMPDANR